MTHFGRKLFRRIRRWVVLVIYEAPLIPSDGPTRRQHTFYLRKNGEIRGNESDAHRFWTERGSRAAAAELKLSGRAEVSDSWKNFMSNNSYRLVEIRIERVRGL